jgi:hypothetical protein
MNNTADFLVKTLAGVVFSLVLAFIYFSYVDASVKPTAEASNVNIVGKCLVSGCSGELCVDANLGPIASPCIWKEEFVCYQSAKCETQSDGRCGWTQTEELKQCLAGTVKSNPPVISIIPTPTNTPFCQGGECEADPGGCIECEEQIHNTPTPGITANPVQLSDNSDNTNNKPTNNQDQLPPENKTIFQFEEAMGNTYATKDLPGNLLLAGFDDINLDIENLDAGENSVSELIDMANERSEGFSLLDLLRSFWTRLLNISIFR